MLSKAHFNAACELSWRHAITLSFNLANGDETIITYCTMFFKAEELATNNAKSINDEPYFAIREFCVNKLADYYKKHNY